MTHDPRHQDAFKIFAYHCQYCGYQTLVHNERNDEAPLCLRCPECRDMKFHQFQVVNEGPIFQNRPPEVEFRIHYGSPLQARRILKRRQRGAVIDINTSELDEDTKEESRRAAIAHYDEQIEKVEAGEHPAFTPGFPVLARIDREGE